MIENRRGWKIDEELFDEAVKELYYSGLDGNGLFKFSPDSGEYKQARDALDGFLEENIKDEDILKTIDDLKDTLLVLIEAQGFVDGFKVASLLSRKSSLPDLNEALTKVVHFIEDDAFVIIKQ